MISRIKSRNLLVYCVILLLYTGKCNGESNRRLRGLLFGVGGHPETWEEGPATLPPTKATKVRITPSPTTSPTEDPNDELVEYETEVYDEETAKVYDEEIAEMNDEEIAEMIDEEIAEEYDEDIAKEYNEEIVKAYDEENTEEYNEDNNEKYDEENTEEYDEDSTKKYDEENTEEYGEENTEEYDEENTEEYDEENTEKYDEDNTEEYDEENTEKYDEEIIVEEIEETSVAFASPTGTTTVNPTEKTGSTSPTSEPTRSPSVQPTSAPTGGRLVEKVFDKELEIIDIVQNPTADALGILIVAFGVIGMILTAWQILENPDGLCSSCCRLSVNISRCLLAVLCLPCNVFCGKYAGYQGTDRSDRAKFLTPDEYTHDLTLELNDDNKGSGTASLGSLT